MSALSSAKPRLGVLAGATRYGDPRDRSVRFCFDLLDLDEGATEPHRIPLDFWAHGFAVCPRRPHRAALLEKRGPGGAFVDLVERAVLCPITPMDGHHFYGHGAFSKRGDVLFAVENDLATNQGVISIRDGESFAVLDRFPTYGEAPHDCTLLDDGATLVVTNGGGKLGEGSTPSVTFVDVTSQKLLERCEVDNERINTGHVALTRDRSFVVVSAPRDGLPESELGGVSLRLGGGPLRYAKKPEAAVKRMVGESLSVCIHERAKIAIATHPYGDLLTFWNLATGALFASIDLPGPRGVTCTLDGSVFAISFGPAASLLLLQASPLKPLNQDDPGARRFGGSHLYTWERPSA